MGVQILSISEDGITVKMGFDFISQISETQGEVKTIEELKQNAIEFAALPAEEQKEAIATIMTTLDELFQKE